MATAPEQNELPTGDKKDYAQKELDQIQGIINRMFPMLKDSVNTQK